MGPEYSTCTRTSPVTADLDGAPRYLTTTATTGLSVALAPSAARGAIVKLFGFHYLLPFGDGVVKIQFVLRALVLVMLLVVAHG